MATSSALDPVFDAAGAEWNVDPNILRAVAGTESAGDTRAQSSKGAQGLMQITPDTQKYLGVTDPHDPVQSIYGAAKYLSEAQEKEGTTAGALLYYHGGPGWRGAYGPESAGYVPAIAKQYQQIVARSSGAGNPAGNPTPRRAIIRQPPAIPRHQAPRRMMISWPAPARHPAAQHPGQAARNRRRPATRMMISWRPPARPLAARRHPPPRQDPPRQDRLSRPRCDQTPRPPAGIRCARICKPWAGCLARRSAARWPVPRKVSGIVR
jgi:hypothetical protein